MKSYIKSVIWRIIVLLVIGVVLVVYSDQAPKWLVQSIGVLLMLPGIVSIMAAFRKENTALEKIMFPVLGMATIVFGVLLVMWSQEFIQAFMYVIAGLLILVSIMQFFDRIDMIKRGISISKWSFLIPVLVFATGIFVIVYFREISQLPFVLMGASCILYAILEVMSLYQLHRFKKEHPEYGISEIAAQEIDEDEKAVLD